MQDLNTIPSVGTFGEVARNANTNFSLLKIAVDLLEHSIEHSRGYFTSASALTSAFPSPAVGDWAIVEVSGTPTIYKCSTRGTWSNSGTPWAGGSVDLTEYAQKAELYNSGYYICETAAATAAKTVSASGYLLKAGGNIRIKMSYANTAANATLNIGGTGAKPLYYNDARASASNSWEAEEVVVVYYDGEKFIATNSQGGGGKLKVDDNFTNSDLDINDNNDFTLVRFSEGHVKTKNFDSRDVKTKVANSASELTDLDIADEDGNILVQFSEGHLRTKNFDSSKLIKAGTTTFYENFLVSVDKGVENNIDTTDNLQDTRNIQQDRCIINLPPNYSPNGEPVRLIISNFGSQGRIQASTTKANWTMPLVDTMLAEGYAVMQVNGTPGETEGIPTFGGMGTPQFLRSVVKAYTYVINKYNIKTDGVFLSGWSQGTLKSWQIAANLQGSIPVKAAVLYGFCLDLWKLMYAYTPETNREWMCEQFGFVEKEANEYVLDIFSDIYSQGDVVTKPTSYSAEKTLPNDYEFAYILNNYETWIGYDPVCWGTSKDIIGEQFRYRSWVTANNPNEDLCFQDVSNIIPCPMKVFTGLNDVYTTPKLARWYQTMAKNGGMECHFRWYQDGSHSYPTSYQTIQVLTKYAGTITTNVPSWEGMLFLERYD